MDAATITTILAGGVTTGLIGNVLVQFTKTHVAARWRTVYALTLTAVISAIGVGVAVLAGWLTGDTVTWATVLTQAGLAVGVAQTTYGTVTTIAPGASKIDLDTIITAIKTLYAQFK